MWLCYCRRRAFGKRAPVHVIILGVVSFFRCSPTSLRGASSSSGTRALIHKRVARSSLAGNDASFWVAIAVLVSTYSGTAPTLPQLRTWQRVTHKKRLDFESANGVSMTLHGRHTHKTFDPVVHWLLPIIPPEVRASTRVRVSKVPSTMSKSMGISEGCSEYSKAMGHGWGAAWQVSSYAACRNMFPGTFLDLGHEKHRVHDAEEKQVCLLPEQLDAAARPMCSGSYRGAVASNFSAALSSGPARCDNGQVFPASWTKPGPIDLCEPSGPNDRDEFNLDMEVV